MNSMYLLSLLLTADLTKAEECFVSGLEDCVEGTYVFRDWARSWARRTIIQNAIRMLAPRRSHSAATKALSDTVGRGFGRTPEAGYAIAAILHLEEFERFVFVMSVLEKYSDHECSILLGCARQDIAETRMRALLHLAESGEERPLIDAGFDSKEHQEAATRET
jgi:DNA-directed RNA polymerase specialized sigma24 family protein